MRDNVVAIDGDLARPAGAAMALRRSPVRLAAAKSGRAVDTGVKLPALSPFWDQISYRIVDCVFGTITIECKAMASKPRSPSITRGKAAETAPASSLLRRPPRLGEEVYNAIFARIMSLQIAPGGRITVDGLARELGVSQTPIREALARLESEGLVIKQHLIGFSAAPQLSRKQFNDLYELRLLLEPDAAAKAALSISDAAMAELVSLDAQMKSLDQQQGHEPYALFAPLDTAFHDQIAASADNELVVEALSRLHTHVHLFRLLYNAVVTTAALEEHTKILDAIKRRDAAGASAAMRQHIERSRDRFKAKYPD
jgi:DNA-binding GntR family transcriptional regulator